MGRTVGLVTIGQSPRPDLIEEYERALPGARLVQAGALDGLSEAEILALAPGAGDDVLVSRLRTGREVRLARRYLEPRLQSWAGRPIGARPPRMSPRITAWTRPAQPTPSPGWWRHGVPGAARGALLRHGIVRPQT